MFKPLIFKNTGTQFVESSDEVLNEIEEFENEYSNVRTTKKIC